MAATALQNVGVVGAGAMGRGIAQVCATAGCQVYLLDSAPEASAQALNAVRHDINQAVAKGRLAPEEAEAILERIHPASNTSALGTCDLVVEAIVEKLEAKQALFRDLERVVASSCILATNTSSLSVTALAAVCERPERVAGWHFFNPVPRMRVVEVIRAPRTDRKIMDALADLSRRIGHRAIVTSDSPGFVVNHAGRAFVTEGLKLLAERAAEHPTLDTILRTCAGFRMGPFELLDLTGLDVSVPVMESIHAQYYGDDRYRPSALARTRMQAGLLGRKSGRGFYDYQAATPPAPEQQPSAPPPAVRLWWPDDGPMALGALANLLPPSLRTLDPSLADALLLAPMGTDLSTAVADSGLDGTRCIAIDPLFGGAAGVTLMTCPATHAAALAAVQTAWAAQGVSAHVIADSPGYVAPRVVACIINLACEMAQQGIASPADIDAAVQLGLGYPHGPFEWGDQLGAQKVQTILEGLYSTFGDQRYRPSPWLVRRARLSLPLSTADRTV